MLNRIVLVGRMVKDPEIKYSQTGKAITTFTLAVDRAFAKEGQQDADFPRVVQFGKGAEATANYMSKGSMVGVDGRLSTRTWEDESGKKQYATEVIADQVKFLESRNKGESQQNSQQSKQNQHNDFPEPDPTDSLPF